MKRSPTGIVILCLGGIEGYVTLIPSSLTNASDPVGCKANLTCHQQSGSRINYEITGNGDN